MDGLQRYLRWRELLLIATHPSPQNFVDKPQIIIPANQILAKNNLNAKCVFHMLGKCSAYFVYVCLYSESTNLTEKLSKHF